MSTDDQNDESEPVVGGLPPGTTLSDTYEIVKQIGLGGMAEVYRARNIHTDEPVAIKVVLPEFARDQTNLALFKKEATVLSRLHHDAIVRYHTFTVEKSMKRPYLVMEFVDGVPLSEHIKRAPLDAESTRLLIKRIAAGLAAAHEVDVVHRDLSPDNVILPDDNVSKTKIVDFGIAKAGKIGEGTLLGGKFAGKYNFVSPEQLGLAGGEVTGQSDIYSLGLIAAAAQLGHALNMSGSQLDVLEKRRVVPDLTGVDPSLLPAVTAMLQPLPQHRPRTMNDVIAMLEAPPQPARPAQLTDTGTVFGAEMPYSPPPVRDPWAEGRPAERSLPPQPQNQTSWHTPPAERSQPPQGSWPTTPPGERSMPPQGSWPAAGERSVPPGYGAPPMGERSMPPVPFDPGQPAPGSGLSERSSPPRSESPFGPYEGPSNPPSFGKSRSPKPQAKSNAGLFIALGLVVLLLGGGGGLFFMTGGFGLLGTPTEPEVVTPEPPAEPIPTPPAEPETIVADTTPPPKTTPEQLTGAAARIAWLNDYKLAECQYAAPITVAENSMAIEAFGNSVAPYERMLTDFKADNGFEPDVEVRLIVDPQCAVADFMRAVQPKMTAGPAMALSTDTLPSGGTLSGTISDTATWSTDLLLIDYRGGVQNISTFLTSAGSNTTFALPPLLSKTSDSVPMIIIAVSSRTPLNSTKLVRTHEARQIFPVIQHEIENLGADVSVAVKYFKLGGAAPAAQ